MLYFYYSLRTKGDVYRNGPKYVGKNKKVFHKTTTLRINNDNAVTIRYINITSNKKSVSNIVLLQKK